MSSIHTSVLGLRQGVRQAPGHRPSLSASGKSRCSLGPEVEEEPKQAAEARPGL